MIFPLEPRVKHSAADVSIVSFIRSGHLPWLRRIAFSDFRWCICGECKPFTVKYCQSCFPRFAEFHSRQIDYIRPNDPVVPDTRLPKPWLRKCSSRDKIWFVRADPTVATFSRPESNAAPTVQASATSSIPVRLNQGLENNETLEPVSADADQAQSPPPYTSTPATPAPSLYAASTNSSTPLLQQSIDTPQTKKDRREGRVAAIKLGVDIVNLFVNLAQL